MTILLIIAVTLATLLVAEVAAFCWWLHTELKWLHDVLIPWMNSIHNEIHGVDSFDVHP